MSSYIYEAIEHDKRFPAKIFTTSIGKSSYHWHYDYELMLVLKGSVILNIFPESCIMKTGDIALVNSKTVHGLSKTNEDNICLFIQLKQELFENWQDKNQNYRYYLNSAVNKVEPKVPYATFIRNAALIGLEYEGKHLSNFYRIKALLYTLIADLFEYTHYDIREYSDKSATVEESDTLLKILEYIDLNYYSDNITEELCSMIGMCEKTLYRFLKRHTDLTVKELVISLKIEKAQFLLSSTEKPINTIAHECCFGNDKTFYRIFKKETGVTPMEYRLHGSNVEKNKQVQGYLSFSKNEAIELMKRML
jgi:AraC-like DNA-binding protein/mannose-6-phosphate isomerase-like protein (cupin superfamily)